MRARYFSALWKLSRNDFRLCNHISSSSRNADDVFGDAIVHWNGNFFVKLAAQHVHVIEVVFFRNFLAVLIIGPFLLKAGIAQIRMKRPGLYVSRAAINFIGMLCGFTSVTLIPLAENTALSFTSPIFVTIGAVIFLGEVKSAYGELAILIGFTGALIILQPGISEVSAGALLALASSLSIAMAVLLVKKMTETETSIAIVFWMVVMQAPISLAPALFVWQWPGPLGWLYLWGVAISGTIAHVLFTRACGLVEITSLQPVEFVKLPFAVILAWFIFDEWPGVWIWVGGAIIFTATAYIHGVKLLPQDQYGLIMRRRKRHLREFQLPNTEVAHNQK